MTDPGSPPVPTPAAPSPEPAKKGLSPLAWVAIGCGGLTLIGLIAVVVLGVSVFQFGRRALDEATDGQSLSDIVESLEDNPVKTLAEAAIRLNPEFRWISTDEDAGTITFFHIETEQEVTMSFSDVAEGRFTMTTNEGEFVIDGAGDDVAAASAAEGGVTFTGPGGQTRLGSNISLDDAPEWVPIYPGSSNVQMPYVTSSANGASGMLSGSTGDSVERVVDYYQNKIEDLGFTVGNVTSSQSGTTDLGSLSATGDDGTINVTATKQGGEDTQFVVMFDGTQSR